MAKKQFVGVQTFDDAPVADPVREHIRGDGPGRYRVALQCPTPLAHASLEVEAESPEQAKAAFHRANGIDGSDHTYDIEKVG